MHTSQLKMREITEALVNTFLLFVCLELKLTILNLQCKTLIQRYECSLMHLKTSFQQTFKVFYNVQNKFRN